MYHYFYFLACFTLHVSSFHVQETRQGLTAEYKSKYISTPNLADGFLDIIRNIPLHQLSIVFDNFSDYTFIDVINKEAQNESISVTLYNVSLAENQSKFFKYFSNILKNFDHINCLFVCSKNTLEYLFTKFQEHKFIHRNIMYIIYWQFGNLPNNQLFLLHVNILFITENRRGTLLLYHNKQIVDKNLTLINWWNIKKRLFRIPTLPAKKDGYINFNGAEMHVPVIHKPPWYFVRYVNNTMQVMGGRDDKLLKLLAKKLHFRYHYFDPANFEEPFFMNGSSFQSSINMVKARKADLFLGDVTLTLERSKDVEFSFFTLADSGAFVTHAPSRLNEALALVRPFQYEVWPAVILILLCSGPLLFILLNFNLVQGHKKNTLSDCIWFMTNIFLKQSVKELSNRTRPRVYFIILSLAITYVIGDMYSANLTSLLAKPGREKPIHNLQQLEHAIQSNGFKLFVEKNSSPYLLLQNGSGIYKKLWKLMKKQDSYLISSVEEGVKMVKNSKNIAVFGGRETLFFDIQRFGTNYFHLSEKLNTEYSAIALQIGCPYIENINKILIILFEAGVLTKMTLDEYEKLGKQTLNNENHPDDQNNENVLRTQSNRANKIQEDDDNSQPINLKMLQGAFYILLGGYIFSSFIFYMELKMKKEMKLKISKLCRKATNYKFKNHVKKIYRNLFKLLKTKSNFEYTE